MNGKACSSRWSRWGIIAVLIGALCVTTVIGCGGGGGDSGGGGAIGGGTGGGGGSTGGGGGGTGGGGGGTGGGGTGGGGGGPQPCGSAANSTTPVICGQVMVDLTTTPASGVSVILRDSAGNELRRTSTDASGNFKFSPATNGTQLEISAPPASYTATMVRYQGRIYDFDLPNQAGTGKCYIGTGVKPGDTNIGIVYVFPITSPPPPPMGGCPR